MPAIDALVSGCSAVRQAPASAGYRAAVWCFGATCPSIGRRGTAIFDPKQTSLTCPIDTNLKQDESRSDWAGDRPASVRREIDPS